MFSLAKLLLPVDFSDRSVGAARYAIQVARYFESAITLMHVVGPVPPPPHDYPDLHMGSMPGDQSEDRRSRAEERLRGFVAGEFRDLKVNRVVEEGDPALQIIDFAHSGKFDLIIMPTHGYGPFRRLLLGSVTAKVLHGADCPVWTNVHAENLPRVEVDLKHIVASVDLGPHAASVVQWAAWIAAAYEARLTIVHVVSLDPRTEAYYFSPEWRGQLIRGAKAHIEKIQSAAGIRAELHLELGDVHTAVRSAAETLRADLLVIGRSPASGIAGRLPSHAYAIIRDSPCPVVSV